MMWRSGLSETSVTLDEERLIANSRNFVVASFSSFAKPDVTKILGLDDCISSISCSLINRTSTESFLKIFMSDSSLIMTSV